MEDGQTDERGYNCHLDQPRPGGHSDGGDHPQPGGRSQPPNRLTRSENGAGAEETDSRHNLGGDAGGIAPKGDADRCEESGSEADQHVGSKAGVLMTQLPLKADNRRQCSCHDHVHDRVEIELELHPLSLEDGVRAMDMDCDHYS